MASPPNGTDFERLIASVAAAGHERRIELMLVGGQAVLLHGVPRLTQGIDVTLGLTPDDVDRVIDLCASISLEPLPADPRRFARDRFVLPTLHRATGIRVDFIFSSIPYERQALGRAVHVRLAGVDVPFAAVEDLILYKLFAGRPRDLEDIAGIVRRKGPEIDWQYVASWAHEFAVIEGREHLPQQVRTFHETASD
jgi:hypothetical protein